MDVAHEKNEETQVDHAFPLNMVRLLLCPTGTETQRLLSYTHLPSSHSSQISKSLRFLRNGHRDIEELEGDLQQIKEFLKGNEEEEGSYFGGQNNWIANIRRAAFDAEDLVELYHLATEYQQKLGFLHYLSPIKVLTFQVASKILGMKVRTNTIVRDIRNSENTTDHSSRDATKSEANDQMPLRECTPVGKEKSVIGLDADISTLICELIRHDDTKLRSISIVGMGGIGKTTLAGKLYTHPTVVEHFTSRLWIPVTQQFSYRDLLIAILLTKSPSQQRGKPLGELQDAELEDKVRKYLEGKKYLAVLDDVWTQNSWDQLRGAFPDRSMRSRLIVTTRNSELQTRTPGICHQIKLLNEQESQELLRHTASIREDEPELMDIQNKLLKRCAGLPLAVVAVGSKLKGKRTEQWEDVYHELTCLQGPLLQDITKVLALSYDDMSLDLRSCFQRVSFFPEDTEISTKKLIYLWAAEDLIPLQGDQRPENLGKVQLNKLITRNVIQAPAETSDGVAVKRCSIHPLMLVISSSKAKEEIFFQTQNSSEIRHMALFSSSPFSSHLAKAPHLRSLLTFHAAGKILVKQLNYVCSFSKLLRVLYLEGMNIRKLSDAIGSLWNLRYLNLCKTGIRHLPRSMRLLLRLSTLDIRKNKGLSGVSIVKSLKNLRNLHLDESLEPLRLVFPTNLRHLGWVHLQDLHSNDIDSIVNLEVLKVIVTDSTLSRTCDEVLKALSSLEHLICLKINIENCPSSLPLLVAKLNNMDNLRALHLKIKMPTSGHEEFLQPLARMERLVCLKLLIANYPSNYQLSVGMFTHMQSLRTLHLKVKMPHSERFSDIPEGYCLPAEEMERLPNLSIPDLQSACIEQSKLLYSGVTFPEVFFLELL